MQGQAKSMDRYYKMYIVPKTAKNILSKLAIIIGVAIVVSAICSNGVLAVRNTFPDPVDPLTGQLTNNMTIVSNSGGSYQLDAETAIFITYSHSPTPVIELDRFCSTSSTNWKYGNFKAKASVYKLGFDEIDTDLNNDSIQDPPIGTIENNGSGCSYDFIRVTNANPLGLTSILGHEGYYVALVVVEKTSLSAGGINGFVVKVNDQNGFLATDAYVTFQPQTIIQATNQPTGSTIYYPTDNGFGVLDKGFSPYPSQSSFTFTFGTDCDITANVRVYLRWQDADYGRSNEDGENIQFQLIDITNSANHYAVPVLVPSGNQYTEVKKGDLMIDVSGHSQVGVNGVKSWGSFTAEPEHKYAWVWSGVDGNNGVQIWLPFSEMNTRTCRSASGTVTPSSTPESDMEQGETATFAHQILPSGVTGNPTVTYQIKRETFNYSATPTASPGSSANCVQGVDNSCNPVTKTLDNNNPITVSTTANSSFVVNAPPGSYICEYLVLGSPSLGVTIGSPNPSRVCVHVIARPIVKFSGLDVDFCINQANPTASVGNVYTWARLNSSSAYIGSSSQYALFVYGAINDQGTSKEGFFSKAIGSVTNPKALTFANTSGTFGTDWGNATLCTNYFNDEYGTAGENLPADRTGIEISVGDYVVNDAMPITKGQHKTVYVIGDAVIKNNIFYPGNPSWNQTSDIPSYRLIVKGNIFISGDVSQLDGFYFATENIYTCANETSTTFPGYSSCTKPLTIYGAFMSLGSIKYWRTSGTLSQDTSAETFIFSPEMLLSQWMGSSDSSQNPIQSIKSMPPVF